MNRYHLYIPEPSAPLQAAARTLARAGISFAADAEDANLLLWPIPSAPRTAALLPGQAVIGGKLDFLPAEIPRLDLLKDPGYLWSNAAITAEAALGKILAALPCLLSDALVLIVGWGRIARCLAARLCALHVPLTVCARNPEDRAMAQALGLRTFAPEAAPGLRRFRCIVNTVPAVVFPSAETIPPDCFLLDLASGVFLPGDRVCSARGLPGTEKPEASGALIARCILNHLEGGDPF